MFVPQQSVLEVFLRGTIMYLGMFALLRIFRRQAGSLGIADLLVIVVIAYAAQNGMAGDSKSITEALIVDFDDCSLGLAFRLARIQIEIL